MIAQQGGMFSAVSVNAMTVEQSVISQVLKWLHSDAVLHLGHGELMSDVLV